MTEEGGHGALVPQPQGPLEHRSLLMSRGRSLALEILRPVTTAAHWTHLGIRSIRWATASPGRWEIALCGMVEPSDEWTIVWGSPNRRTARTGSWMRGRIDAGRFHECGALAEVSRLAIAAYGQSEDCLVATMPLTSEGRSEPRVILRTLHIDPARTMDFSPDGSRLVVGTLNGTVRVVEIATDRELLCLGRAAYSPDQVGYENAAVYLPNGGHAKRVNAVRYHPSGGAVLSGSRDGTASLWDDTSGRELQRYEHGSDIRAVAFAKQGAAALSAGTDSMIRCWGVDDGNEFSRIPCPPNVSGMAVSPTNRWVVWGSSTGDVGVWDLQRAREVRRFSLDPSEKSQRRVVGIRFPQPYRFVVLFESGAVLRVRLRGGV